MVVTGARQFGLFTSVTSQRHDKRVGGCLGGIASGFSFKRQAAVPARWRCFFTNIDTRLVHVHGRIEAEAPGGHGGEKVRVRDGDGADATQLLHLLKTHAAFCLVQTGALRQAASAWSAGWLPFLPGRTQADIVWHANCTSEDSVFMTVLTAHLNGCLV